jgi:hypothetical protein
MRKKAGDVVVVRVSELGDREDANFHSPKAQLARAKVWSEDEGNRRLVRPITPSWRTSIGWCAH